MLSSELIAFYRQLSQQTFSVVDVETTGAFAWEGRVTEVSVLQASLADGVIDQQTDLVNAQKLVPLKIVQYTGITQSMVDAAPLSADVFPNYWPLLQRGVLTAHNLEFDYSFLQMEYRRLEMEFVRPEVEQLCTVKLARLMLPELRSRSLPNLVQHFRFNVGKSHRAEADTLACWLLAERLLREILDTDDAVLLAKFAQQWLPLKDVARLLHCAAKTAQTRLAAAGVDGRYVGQGKRGTWMYRRGAVERLVLLDQIDQTDQIDLDRP
jgi:DNA polymerase III subunit epsilon